MEIHQENKHPAPPWAAEHQERWELASEASYGRRRPIARRLRWAVDYTLRGISRILRTFTDENAPRQYHIRPAPRNSADAADIYGRLKWYLPNLRDRDFRREGALAEHFDGTDAPWLDPALFNIKDSGAPLVAEQNPGQTKFYIVHKASPRTILRMLPHLGRAAIVDPTLFYTTEEMGFNRLRRHHADTSMWFSNLDEAQERFASLAGARTAFVVGTGPSATRSEVFEQQADVRIICNSAVRNHELIETLGPQIICFGDPVFHFGPSQYAAAFRKDMLRAAEYLDSLVVVPSWEADLLLNHYPQLQGRVLPLEMRPDIAWRWISPTSLEVRATGNVLTEMMLPTAFALADQVIVAGCDGRNPAESYFWTHNRAVQYSDELMATVFAAHPAFFRDRSYVDYYERHCEGLEIFIRQAEAHGKSTVSITPSHIPALKARERIGSHGGTEEHIEE